ncbi:amidohydrolase family protein [Streptomyces monomycini]|uniref:amidohydrolase family protein n=1 Tax=Streptomyces monomycini TaxID=371720 RepID=UPI0024494603|nr:amidohydrolase family protein [Streptomyces monomycini]
MKFAGGGGFTSAVNDPDSTSYTQAETHTIVATATDLGLPCATHALSDRAVRRAVTAGVRSIEHGYFATTTTYQAMEEAGIYLVPTQYVQTYFLDRLDDDTYWDSDTAATRRNYRAYADRLRQGLQRPARTGITMAFGTDAGLFPHAENWREFPTLVSNGFSPLRTLRSATSTAAALLDRPDLGTLTPDATADLVAVEGNPFRDITATGRTRYVMRNGHLITPHPGATF